MQYTHDSRGVSPLAAVILLTAVGFIIAAAITIIVAAFIFDASLPTTVVYIIAAVGVIELIRDIVRTVSAMRDGIEIDETDALTLTESERKLLGEVAPETDLVVVAERHSGVYRVTATEDVGEDNRSIECERVFETETGSPTTITFNRDGSMALLADPSGDESDNAYLRAVAAQE